MSDHPTEGGPAPGGAGPRPARLELPGHVYDLLICVGIGAIGVWFFASAFALPPGRRAVDAATIPLIASGILILLCLAQAIVSVRGRGTLGAIEIERPLHVAMAMVLIVLFPSLIDRFGYYLTAVIWLPAFGWIAGIRRWLPMLIVVAAVLALARFVFEMVLGTPLP